jgi:CrcB protein
LGTWAVNLLGSMALGLVVGHPGLPPLWRSALGIGFLGGFTTFSSWAVEGARLLEAGRPGAAALHLGGQLLIGLIAALAGLALARRCWGG